MLGFEMASGILSSVNITSTNATIWMDDVACTGSELEIAACSFAGWGVHDCTSEENVGIICTSKLYCMLSEVDMLKSLCYCMSSSQHHDIIVSCR